MRSTSTTGTVAAPVTANRSELEVVVVARRVVEQGLVDGGRPGQHGDAVLLDRLQRAQRIERQVRDQRRAGLQAGQDAGLVAEVVEERVDAQVAVVAGDLAVGGPRRRARQRLPVRAQHTFAAAGGAGGEQDVADVVGRDGGGAGDDRGCAFRSEPALDELVPGSVVASSIGIRTMCRSAGRAARSRSAARSLPRNRPIANSTGASVRARMSPASAAV